jgi:PhnB protein
MEDDVMAATAKQPPITPHLTVSDAAAAIEFYKAAFGAEEMFRLPAPDGRRVMHCSLQLNGGRVMLNDDFPEFCDGKRHAPDATGGSGVTIHLEVGDVDAAFARAVKAGAAIVMPVADMFWGDRYGVLRDPYGHSWSLATHQRDLSPAEIKAAAAECFGKKDG